MVKLYSFDPTRFWMLFVINLAIAASTPPFVYTLFSLKGSAPGVPLQMIYAAAWQIVMIFSVRNDADVLYPFADYDRAVLPEVNTSHVNQPVFTAMVKGRYCYNHRL